MSSTPTHDAIIIGGGHNGLVCAAYLGMAGLKVKVLERRAVVGGAAVTEEFHPGFRNSVAAYTVSLLNPKVIRDLRLHDHGLRIVERRAQNFLPTLDGRYLLAAEGKTEHEVARFSQRDAGRLDAFNREIDTGADVLRDLVLQAPPNLTTGRSLRGLGELMRAGKLGNRLRRLSTENLRVILDLFTKSAGDYLDQWFEGDLIKALFGFDAVVGNYASPYTPGTAYVLLHHAFGEVNGKRRVWGHAIGGMGAITQAMAKAAASHGVEIETGAAVREVLVERERACGVVLADGRVIRGRLVAANVNPRLLYTTMVPEQAVSADVLRRMHNWRCGSGTFRMNVALSSLPSFTALPGSDLADHHTSGIIMAPSLGYMDRAFADARQHGWSREPIIEMLIPSTLDDSLAPKGAHVASLFCQHFDPDPPAGWDALKPAAVEAVFAQVESFCPNFRRALLGYRAWTPLDLERDFGLTAGDIFHGQLSPDQLFSLRPVLGYARYRGPLAGLYHCGSGAHPGGGVSAAPGYNAAREIIRDLAGKGSGRRARFV